MEDNNSKFKITFTQDVENMTDEQMEEIFNNVEIKLDDLQHMTTNEGTRINSKRNNNLHEIKINEKLVNKITKDFKKNDNR